jgi:hypothetical protein
MNASDEGFISSRSVDGVFDEAEAPTGPGLWFVDSFSPAAEMATRCAASCSSSRRSMRRA